VQAMWHEHCLLKRAMQDKGDQLKTITQELVTRPATACTPRSCTPGHIRSRSAPPVRSPFRVSRLPRMLAGETPPEGNAAAALLSNAHASPRAPPASSPRRAPRGRLEGRIAAGARRIHRACTREGSSCRPLALARRRVPRCDRTRLVPSPIRVPRFSQALTSTAAPPPVVPS
jgi:hypothetical protein